VFVESLTIKNLKLLRDVRISFMDADRVRPWTVLIGENGTGKTSILRALAMAASGATGAMQLAEVDSLPDRRQRDPGVRIAARLQAGGPLDGRAGTYSARAYRSVESALELQHGSQKILGKSYWIGDPTKGVKETRTADVVDEAQTRTDSSWFIVGYGVHRELNAAGAGERHGGAVVDRLAPLFRYNAPILGPSFAEQMLDDELARAYSQTLQKVLVAGNLLPGISGLELRGRGGVRDAATLVEGDRFVQLAGDTTFKLPARWLSQGYQASIVWLSDLIGHAMLHAGRALDSEEIEGLVLIDELDLFIHPAWQRQLVGALRQTFPNVQFVATTHSPLVLSGLRPGEIHRVAMTDNGDVQVLRLDENPQLRTGSELYAEFFGVDGLQPTEAAKWLRRYGFIANNPFRSDEQDAEMRELRRRLSDEGIQVGYSPQDRA
jgi:energy-coupling factor transporter ATP-binding protein EcfA2